MDNTVIIESKSKIPAWLKILTSLSGFIFFFIVDSTLPYFNGSHDTAVTLNVIGLIISAFLIFSPIWLKITIGKGKICVTPKVIYGLAGIFVRRVDLPLDSVSAVSLTRFKGLSVSTSSGVITFHFIENIDAVHSVINNLLINRQANKTPSVATAEAASPVKDVSELKKYKELLDMGAISQAEFDAKKNELLGTTAPNTYTAPVAPVQQVFVCPKCRNMITQKEPVCKVCGTTFNW